MSGISQYMKHRFGAFQNKRDAVSGVSTGGIRRYINNVGGCDTAVNKMHRICFIRNYRICFIRNYRVSVLSEIVEENSVFDIHAKLVKYIFFVGEGIHFIAVKKRETHVVEIGILVTPGCLAVIGEEHHICSTV